jgi:hypothetical protein
VDFGRETGGLEGNCLAETRGRADVYYQDAAGGPSDGDCSGSSFPLVGSACSSATPLQPR